MALRAWWVALLVALAAGLLPVVTDPTTAALLGVAVALLCGAAAVVPAAPAPALGLVRVAAPGTRARRGTFPQQTRPGVPGRTRSRAPGCGR
ncbi:DUF6412 domain-containing protein [Friedmanniella luteola]|uniref:DUF6412 domain-containing protein n=1 Tax=Friedmanniella luteola TaxID=546871 RepID=UPI0012FD28E8|nr:DUF6412 domain-containing protein [Friedmanniella luteola]